jgi:hypothetical protein
MAPAKQLQANIFRLRAVLAFLEGAELHPSQINLATFMTTHRVHESRAPIGCVLGHFARSGLSQSISLIPIRYWDQIKSPIMADTLADEFPSSEWRHWTLKYETASTEAYGMTAVCLYLQMRAWDIHRLFYPAGSSYEVRPPIESLVGRLRNMVETTHAVSVDRDL